MRLSRMPPLYRRLAMPTDLLGMLMAADPTVNTQQEAVAAVAEVSMASPFAACVIQVSQKVYGQGICGFHG
jgi:hypothetical protein